MSYHTPPPLHRHIPHPHASRGPLYRARDGMIFGVCKGLAERAELKTTWIRLVFILALVLTGIWPMVIIYTIAAIFMKPAPMQPLQSDDARDFYNSYVTDRSWALKRLHRKLSDLESRTSRMEDEVVDREFDWEQRLHRGT